MTEMRGTLAESLPAEMEQLMRMYVEPLKLPCDAEEDERTRGDCQGRCAIRLSAQACGG